ncbi:MAG: metallophosphoesterase [Candidatus Velthaea sp.]
MRPHPSALEFPLAPGVMALGSGCAFLTHSRVLLCADAHLGYEDVMGGGAALPLWSTAETVTTLVIAVERSRAREIVFLGDAIHGSSMNEGAVRVVKTALDTLREKVPLTFVAGNHEGRSGGGAILGATVEACERDGWRLLHGDKGGPAGSRAIIGHLHPSLHMGGGVSAPAFLGSNRVVVVPALTPYSSGLDVLSDGCLAALAPWDVQRRDLHVVAATADRVYPFGTLSALRGALRRTTPGDGRFRRYLRPDGR